MNRSSTRSLSTPLYLASFDGFLDMLCMIRCAAINVAVLLVATGTFLGLGYEPFLLVLVVSFEGWCGFQCALLGLWSTCLRLLGHVPGSSVAPLRLTGLFTDSACASMPLLLCCAAVQALAAPSMSFCAIHVQAGGM